MERQLLLLLALFVCIFGRKTSVENDVYKMSRDPQWKDVNLKAANEENLNQEAKHKARYEGRAKAGDYPFRDPSLSWEKRIDDLVSRLTLEEIVQQTITSYSDPGTVGIPRLQIQPYPWITECLHGQVNVEATAFPQALGLSAAFSPELMFNISSAISQEVRANYNENEKAGKVNVYYGLTCYSPVVNIMRHPLWGRNQETYGEDPFLTGTLSEQFVLGLQGDHPRYRRTTATCKHFDAHGGPEDIPVSRYDFDARLTTSDWWMTFLPQFKRCVGAGAGGMMCSYNSINGVPACANKPLLDIARKNWNFTGYITGDAGAIDNIISHHHYLPNSSMTSAAVIKAGCNMEIMGTTLLGTLDAVKMGLLTEKEVRDNVKPLFYVRMRQGEFDPPHMNPYSKLGKSDIQTPENQELAIRAAMMTFVLLKNTNNFLPLKKKYEHLAMVGPFSDNTDAQAGDYAARPSQQFMTTPYGGLKSLANKISMSPGCSDPRCTDYNSTDVSLQLKGADLIVVCLGLGNQVEGEMTDRADLELPGSQFDLLQDVLYQAAGRPVIVLLFNAGPLDLRWAMLTPGVTTILECFYPAQATGEALRRTLTMSGPGPASPAGRLTSTWPAYLNQVGPICNYNMYGRTYRYYQRTPLFPFGFGLSYSNFTYSALTVTPSVAAGSDITVSVNVKNLGPYDSDEVVQVYISWNDSSLPAPKHQLAGYKRVTLRNGETQTVKITVPGDVLNVWMDDKSGYVVPKGKKIVYAGGQQPGQRVKVPSNVLSGSFNIV